MRISVIGSTGSIGVQALDVAKHLGIQVRALAARSNVARLCEQAIEHSPEVVAVGTAEAAAELEALLAGAQGAVQRRRVEILHGPAGLAAAAAGTDADMAVIAVAGIAGLAPALAAARAGKRLALANKECVVAAGSLLGDAMKAGAAPWPALVPLDSEHSAIFQCLWQPCAPGHNGSASSGSSPSASPNALPIASPGTSPSASSGSSPVASRGAALCVDAPAVGVSRAILTASGGPFRKYGLRRLASVTPSQAMEHPVWRMGRKITVDCATLANKGLEVIEASWLFGLPAEMIDVAIHPQGAVHSLVEFRDGAMLAQLGAPDMRTPIQYAFTWPRRLGGLAPPLSLFGMGALTFEPPDLRRFPCLALAYDALREGGMAPAVYNAADEAAVGLFCGGALRFTDIPRAIGRAMEKMAARAAAPLGGSMDGRLAATLAIDEEARVYAAEAARSLA